MPSTYTLQLADGPVKFTRVVRLTHVDGTFDGYPKVWYDTYDQVLGKERNGVVIVLQNGSQVLYCAALRDRSFSQTWLYASKHFLYKQRKNAAEAINAGYELEIHLAVRADSSDGERIIAEYRPSWNS